MPLYRLAFVIAAVQLLPAQMPQNPSPMVEHTRRHPRIAQQEPPGLRRPLESGRIFVPRAKQGRPDVPLLVFFHGGAWLPEVAAAQRGMAAIAIQVGAGSGAYSRAFAGAERLERLIAEAEAATGQRFGRLVLGGWSAGCGAVRALLGAPAVYRRLHAALCIDGIHAGYPAGKPGPLESELTLEDLQPWIALARDAMAGRKSLLITHSEIFPGTFASTTETADRLLRELAVTRRPVLRWGPMGTQQLSEAKSGRFLLIGFAGNSAPDHVDQLHSLGDYLKRLP